MMANFLDVSRPFLSSRAGDPDLAMSHERNSRAGDVALLQLERARARWRKRQAPQWLGIRIARSMMRPSVRKSDWLTRRR
jgi:hypothetical protein